jgi:hypothetical protein
MNVFILGVQHGIQWRDGPCPAPKQQRYVEMLCKLISERGIEYIGEEAPEGTKTFAKDFESIQVKWERIDMSRAEKLAKKIPTIKGREPYLQQDDQNPKIGITEEGYIWEEQKGIYVILRRDDCDRIREDYMCTRILATRGSSDSILVICGYMHALELQEKFQKDQHSVGWDALYKHDWFGPRIL